MRNHTRNKAKQLPEVYFQKYTLSHSVFCCIINAFPYVLEDDDIIFLVLLKIS